MKQPKILHLLQVLFVLCVPSVLSYSSQYYGSKRHARSRVPTYDPYDFYYKPGYGYPMNYYSLYPYAQNIPDDGYYSREGYPAIFYPRTSKYEVYQAVLPYYQDLPPTRAKYYNDYYGTEQDPEERLLQDIEREQREQAQPIGHEIRYETDFNNDDRNIDEINRAFMKNLMAMDDSNPKSFYDQIPYDYSDPIDSTNIPRWDDMPYDRPANTPVDTQVKDDEDVKELKQLTQQQKGNGKAKQGRRQRKQKQRKQKNNNNNSKNEDEIHWFKEQNYMDQTQPEQKRGLFDKTVTYTDRKPIPIITTEQPVIATTNEPQKEQSGQKEEVMMRPATPVRHPLSNSVLEMMVNQEAERERKRVPSVYDTIKKMLEMEKIKEGESATAMEEEVRPSMKKRIVSNEDSLTKQLSVLKKFH